MKIFSLSIDDPKYPTWLKNIFDPPEKLFCAGNLDLLNLPAVAIVGTRACTNYGENIAFSFAKALSTNNIPIISGLAFGIDSFAHKGAMTEIGSTIAVLPSTLPKILPCSHLRLAEQIIENNGLLVSENCSQNMYKSKFLIRNRIIAGLSKGVLIVEAGIRSGAINTAHHANEYGREVFVVPGRITDEKSLGALCLLKDGATPAISPKDICDALKLPFNDRINRMPNLTGVTKKVFESLLVSPKNISEICELLPNDIARINLAVTELELLGFLKLGLDSRYFVPH